MIALLIGGLLSLTPAQDNGATKYSCHDGVCGVATPNSVSVDPAQNCAISRAECEGRPEHMWACLEMQDDSNKLFCIPDWDTKGEMISPMLAKKLPEAPAAKR
ncbi:MAG: hypothetical protein JO111_13450 [Caulobacteraceae bacterium]|nr:hypothetical protein [Caulobacteraceae bacterium]